MVAINPVITSTADILIAHHPFRDARVVADFKSLATDFTADRGPGLSEIGIELRGCCA
jgi:hypothetical protein